MTIGRKIGHHSGGSAEPPVDRLAVDRAVDAAIFCATAILSKPVFRTRLGAGNRIRTRGPAEREGRSEARQMGFARPQPGVAAPAPRDIARQALCRLSIAASSDAKSSDGL